MTHFAQFKRLGRALLLGWAIAIGAASPAAAQCVGDCNNDNSVRIPEVQRCVNIRTGVQPLASCLNADQNLDGSVSPGEVDACIASFLDAATCPRVHTPAATNTVPPATSTPTSVLATATSTTVPTATRTNTAVPTATRTNTPVPTNSPTLPPPTNTPTTAATSTPRVLACAFNGATDASSLQICFLGVCPSPFDIAGAIDIGCDSGAPGANGKRSCQCALQSLNPFVISGIGTVCVAPTTGSCPSGEQDCDGGNALGVDLTADHCSSGACASTSCTGNANCASQCTTYCSGLGKAVYVSGCERFCQGGSRADQACICDTATAATCTGGMAGVNDCPGGSCEGKDNDLGQNQCHCTCVDESFGPASPAGSMNCRVGVAIRIEAGEDGICDGNTIINLPPQCAPFTSGSASAVVLHTNEGAGQAGPFSETGTAETCTNFDGGATGGYELVTVLAFFDSTIGDVMARMQLDCQ